MQAARTRAWFFYMLSLMFAPLAFGTTEEWSFFLLLLFLGLSFVLYMVAIWKETGTLYRVPGTRFFALGFLYVALQLLPMPEGVLRLLSPSASDIWWGQLGEDISGTMGTLSLHIHGGWITLSLLTAFFLVYFLTIQFCADYKTLKKTLHILAVFAGLLAISTIFQALFTKDTALWFRQVERHSMVFGPYVNHNHYAGLMEMLLPLVLALYLLHKPSFDQLSLREKIILFFEGERAHIYILYLFFAVMIMLSVFMSLSRTGIAAMLASLCLFAILIGRVGGRKKHAAGSVMFLFAAMMITLSWYGWQSLDVRFGKGIAQFQNDHFCRMNFWVDAVSIWKDFFLTGSGAGSFREVHPAYQSYVSSVLAGYVHNDYLELLSDTGLVGFGLFFCFLLSVLRSIVKKLRTRKEPYAGMGVAAVLTGVVAMAIHSVMDFNLQIPANGLIFMVLLGLGVSFSHTRFQRRLIPSYLAKSDGPYAVWLPLVFFVLLWTPAVLFSGSSAMARAFASGLPAEKVTTGLSAEVLQRYAISAGKAASFNPVSADYAVAMGDVYFFTGDFSAAGREYARAIRLQPLSGDLVQKLGLVEYSAGNREKGEKLLELGLVFRPMDVAMYRRLAAFYLETGEKEKALAAIARGITMRPGSTGSFLEIMWRAGLSFTDMGRAMPDLSEAWFRYYAFLHGKGYRTAYLTELLEKGFRAARSEERPHRNLYSRLSALYLEGGRGDDAFYVIEEGVRLYPEDPWILYQAGLVCERLHLYARAREYYQRALNIRPAMTQPMQRLERLRDT
ncbi:O-antigen ligase family protein [Desulfobotulus sp. H1]|uniref:O-antigen ligase family protein n=1 Tax=Desulfobotulus pelophilus TaxID=2823377 RepID=A0ABT3NC73_9BACT|nr:O-antigen ligase family protein [Desulfobotulus pelophilus]MCW7755076.1 O-antigen ligase family protein [Desulfobotulus pelophilus]